MESQRHCANVRLYLFHPRTRILSCFNVPRGGKEFNAQRGKKTQQTGRNSARELEETNNRRRHETWCRVIIFSYQKDLLTSHRNIGVFPRSAAHGALWVSVPTTLTVVLPHSGSIWLWRIIHKALLLQLQLQLPSCWMWVLIWGGGIDHSTQQPQ